MLQKTDTPTPKNRITYSQSRMLESQTVYEALPHSGYNVAPSLLTTLTFRNCLENVPEWVCESQLHPSQQRQPGACGQHCFLDPEKEEGGWSGAEGMEGQLWKRLQVSPWWVFLRLFLRIYKFIPSKHYPFKSLVTPG